MEYESKERVQVKILLQGNDPIANNTYILQILPIFFSFLDLFQIQIAEESIEQDFIHRMEIQQIVKSSKEDFVHHFDRCFCRYTYPLDWWKINNMLFWHRCNWFCKRMENISSDFVYFSYKSILESLGVITSSIYIDYICKREGLFFLLLFSFSHIISNFW